MLAAVRFNECRLSGVYVHPDEDCVLGVGPPSQAEEPLGDGVEALSKFARAADGVEDIIDLLMPDRRRSGCVVGSTSAYRPNTAFIMMAIDRNQPTCKTSRR
jgi:hypothetical protein